MGGVRVDLVGWEKDSNMGALWIHIGLAILGT
jgi:hypothetical protein